MFSGAMKYFSQEAYSEASQLAPDERVEYFHRMAEETSWFESVAHGVRWPEFWVSYLHDFVLFTLLGWFSCAVLALILKFNKKRQADA